jgi:hypothetical protein
MTAPRATLLVAAAPPTGLAVNGLSRPADLAGAPFPSDGSIDLSLSWKSPTSTIKGAQPAEWFEVEVDKEGLDVATWRTRVASTVVSVPRSVPLSPDATYRWRVRLNGTGNAWSPPLMFDTAPTEAAWTASQWVGGASQLRTDWELPLGLRCVRARAYASGLGAFELHLNGLKVADHLLDPGDSVVDQKALFVGFNVTSLLRPGANAIGALLGNGKYGYLDMFANRTATGDQSGDTTRAFRLLLMATFEDGSMRSVATDAVSWSARRGPIVYDHLWHGEVYDFRLEDASWANAPLASFPNGTWKRAVRMRPIAGPMFPLLMPPVRVTAVVRPIGPPVRGGAGTDGQPSLTYDFGANGVGVTSITLTPPTMAARPSSALSTATTSTVSSTGITAGSAARMAPVALIVRLRHAELSFANNGSAHNAFFPGMENLTQSGPSPTCSMADWYSVRWFECANQTDAFIVPLAPPAATSSKSGSRGGNGHSSVTYTPTFTFHGFRYVELTARALLADGTESDLPEEIAADFPWGARVEAHRLHTDMPRLTSVSLGGGGSGGGGAAGLSALVEATMATHESNTVALPTDCPQREKRGWMADASISSDSLLTFFDGATFHGNFLRLVADNQRKGCTANPRTPLGGPCTHSGPDPPSVWFNGSVPDQVPFSTFPYGGNPGTVDWQAGFVIMAHSVLLHEGERARGLLTELWPSLAKLMDYFDRQCEPSGLLLRGARGDWLPPLSQTLHTPKELVAAFSHTLAVGFMADIAVAIGLPSEAMKYAARLSSNRRAFHVHFANESKPTTNNTAAASAAATTTPSSSSSTASFSTRGGGGTCCYASGSQASNALALRLGAVPADRVNATLSALVRSFGGGASPPRLDGGIFNAAYIFDVLRDHDLDDLGLSTLNGTEYPSLGYMLSQDAVGVMGGAQ